MSHKKPDAAPSVILWIKWMFIYRNYNAKCDFLCKVNLSGNFNIKFDIFPQFKTGCALKPWCGWYSELNEPLFFEITMQIVTLFCIVIWVSRGITVKYSYHRQEDGPSWHWCKPLVVFFFFSLFPLVVRNHIWIVLMKSPSLISWMRELYPIDIFWRYERAYYG